MNLFTLSKEEAIAKVSQLEQSGELFHYLLDYHPIYVGNGGEKDIWKYLLIRDLELGYSKWEEERRGYYSFDE